MRRRELNYSDEQLMDFLYQGYQIMASELHFVAVGSFYGFVISTNTTKKYFLKVYPEGQSLVPIHPTIESLNQTGIALNRFRNEFGMKNLSYMISDVQGHYCFRSNKLILTLFDYIEGIHPAYTPNQLLADKMATLLFQLHQIPAHEFSFFEIEHFDINYALGIKGWINNAVEVIEKTHAESMLSQLKRHKKQLLQGLSQLQEWKKQFSQQSIPFALTHGDPHHYNVLQTPFDVWLVDWDGVKIAPIERDLWHYEQAPLTEFYLKLNPKCSINHELCRFYQLQRFFEDGRYYLEQVLTGKNRTVQQSEEDKNTFLTHWGWSYCV
ncbi:aminoglycoside phosphotransferase family protein [Legionella longbeachae]|uniref:aminoglycoside phosphotransferase family protein n=1 Tax=Legionella longbeachae TaxID=450 RepID=UPI0009B77720|nr:aminoglycoside phosphotransferase family protein [Legionella longbeachae]ARB92990.1 aminoglycoside phosphotransferase family protein [Legionella longbeachae]RZV26643.1 aminoglycoside phosphotransferase family protein [Legionella longbeachae]UAK47116.1 aminoglycoside phosphotransferase family protein [Legionella longbeachae]VEE04177.1 spectinomycin phosphotransferase [Legionella oakridgensis]